MTQETPQDYWDHADDELLLDAWTTLKADEDNLRDSRRRVEYEILKRLEERQATEMTSPKWTAKLVKPSPQYDMGKLMGLKEEVSPAEWDKVFTPEHMEPVPAKLDMRVAGAWGKRFGTAVAQALERAKLPSGPGTLKLTRKEEKLCTRE